MRKNRRGERKKKLPTAAPLGPAAPCCPPNLSGRCQIACLSFTERRARALSLSSLPSSTPETFFGFFIYFARLAAVRREEFFCLSTYLRVSGLPTRAKQ